MKAIQLNSPVGVTQIATIDIPVPQPGKGEILIRTEAYSFIPGTDDYAGVAGIVERVGSAVSGFDRGNKVYAISSGGICAQYTIIKANQAALMPVNILFAQAAALAAPIMIGHIVLNQIGRLRWGQRLLVYNAESDVAKVIVQLAKTIGAHITVTAGRQQREHLLALGADNCFDEQEEEALQNLADMVLKFTYNGTLAEIRFPRHQASIPAAAAITWQQANQERLLFGKALVEDGSVKPVDVPQVSWKNNGVLQLAIKNAQLGQIVLVMD